MQIQFFLHVLLGYSVFITAAMVIALFFSSQFILHLFSAGNRQNKQTYNNAYKKVIN